MRLSILDRIFWIRVGMGALAGLGADVIFGNDYESGVLLAVIIYMSSYYLLRSLFGKAMPKDQTNKLYTGSIGTFIMLFLFVWILTYTVKLHSLNL